GSLSPLARWRQRYGWVASLSTAQAPYGLREAAKEFMILTDFSRCQGGTIGRVSPPPNLPFSKIRIFHDRFVPGSENRLAPGPGFRTGGLSRRGDAGGPGPRRRQGAGQGQWR